MDIEKEIEKTKDRISQKELKNSIEIISIERKIKVFTNFAWFFVILGAVILIGSFIYFLCMSCGHEFELNLIGDFWAGSVASLWSLAGLFFIYVAFLGQKQQLLNQQLEIMYSQLQVTYTRSELSDQKKEMQLQNETLITQKFENTFFQMTNLLNELINSIDLMSTDSSKKIIASGRDCFEKFFNEFKRQIYNDNKFSNWDQIKYLSLDKVLLSYVKMYDRRKSDLSHYFRTLYHIIKFIDKSNIENKKQYISITRAQLSSYEQVLLFYNCSHSIGKKFKVLIEKYSLLKNIDENLLLNTKHKEAYNISAFEKENN